MTAHKPATALPFLPCTASTRDGRGLGHRGIQSPSGHGVADVFLREDAAYLVHAANSYPKLVEALRHARAGMLLGRNEDAPQIKRLDALLRELGEAE